MKNKILMAFIAIIIIISISIPFKNTYASDTFFEASKNKITKQENIELIINISEIEYEKFKVQIVSDCDIQNIVTNDIDFEETDDTNEIYFEVDKQNINLNKITLTYETPEISEVNDVFTFKALVTNIDNEEESLVQEVQVKIIEEESNDNTNNIANSIDTNQNAEQTNQNLFQNNNESKNAQEEMAQNSEEFGDYSNKSMSEFNGSNFVNQNSKNEFSEAEFGFGNSSSGSLNNNSSNTSNFSSETIAQTEEVTYNGSSDNYLSSLSIDGYSLNKDFNKDCQTYFVNIDDETITSVNVTYTTDSSLAGVCIYGNENLKKGLNKILVNVTAENGNVRTYRIYVTIGE